MSDVECPHCGERNKFMIERHDDGTVIMVNCANCVTQLTTIETEHGRLISREDWDAIIKMVPPPPPTRTISDQAFEFLSVAYGTHLEEVVDDPSILEVAPTVKEAIDDLIAIGEEIKINFWAYIEENCTEHGVQQLRELYDS